jgi:hypothetical protein
MRQLRWRNVTFWAHVITFGITSSGRVFALGASTSSGEEFNRCRHSSLFIVHFSLCIARNDQ